MTRGRCTPNPVDNPFVDLSNTNPNDLMVEYYKQRSSSGLIITEATAISEMGSGWLNAPHIRTPENVAGWKKIVDAVHEKNGVIYLQLWHMGRQSHSSFHPSTNEIVSASAIPVKGVNSHDVYGNRVDYETPRPMTIDEIKSTVQDYVKAAQLAKEAGFDGVEVHGANGYLLDQFLQSSTNVRTDEYGGSMENRYRFTKEVIEAIIQDGSFPANRIGIRFTPNGAFGDMGSEDNDQMFVYVAQQLNKFGLAFIHVVDGLGFGFHNKCRALTVMDFKKVFDGPIIANCGMTKEIAEGMIRSGGTDLTAFGRLYISNPDLPERFANNWPLAKDAPFETYWSPIGAKGYTDWPVYEDKDAMESKEREGKQDEL
eukprot:CAMPEP_0116852418 /NCGR_PEP_ID=MMETSP0418-20121206/17279_1 /TAXON_ID=1158023 /ORGANISM="Astrosyne radiata, Strain 13vi08-1A" /LENGTH=369 /DNA_ID=CAMNT_0004484573 /DNA_START=33 /DNA_END=1142 /DNA_ORIENTATION=+